MELKFRINTSIIRLTAGGAGETGGTGGEVPPDHIITNSWRGLGGPMYC